MSHERSGGTLDIHVDSSLVCCIANKTIELGFSSDRSPRPKTSFEAISMNDRLVSLFVALESLLIFDENEPLANNIAERAAFLLANNYKYRATIKKFMKDMYKLRSAHVHHGKSELDHDKLRKFTNYVQNIILTLIIRKDRMKLITQDHLKNWFERKKLT